MDRLLRGDEELQRQTEQLDIEDQELESDNHLAARTFEDEASPTEYSEEDGYMPEAPQPEIPGPGVEADRVHFPLEHYEEEEERAPAVTGSLVDESFSEDSFEATYEFRANDEYAEEVPVIAQLESDQVETLLEKGNEDMNVTVSHIDNGMMVTAQYNDPASATEAVYEVNQVVETLDEITDEQPV
ncbi:hypothetical protein GKQ38_00045 [Candidatus Nanohaloarchaea archaeon]|nr:hypothetical protein GKQ38_00045 [Candidatus Nanohaloarchaea archaeon]